MSNVKIGDILRYIGPEGETYDKDGTYQIQSINVCNTSILFTNGLESCYAYEDVITPCNSRHPWWEKVEEEVTQVRADNEENQEYIGPFEFIKMLTQDVDEFASYFKILNASATRENWRKGFSDYITRKCDTK
jgi:uncharacterized protein with gpF-like domain